MIELIFLIAGTGALAYEVVYSKLAFYIKRFFFLHREQPVLILLSSFKAYFKILGFSKTMVLFPLIGVLVLICNFYRYIQKLLACTYCTTFQIAFWSAFLWLGFPVITSVLIASTSLIGTALYNLIRMNAI